MVVDRGMDGGELLQTSHTLKTLHRAFSSSEWQVRVLNAIVEPPTRPFFFGSAKLSESGPVRCEAIRDDGFRLTVSLRQCLEEFQRCSFVSAFGDNGFHHLTFLINSTPKIVPLAIHLHKNLIHVPLPFEVCSHLPNTLSSDFSSKYRAKPVPPISDSFVPHVDASLVQQVFDIPKRKRETDVWHHCKADDLGTGFEILERR